MSTYEDALKHVPRAYQDEIFEQARRGNVIAVLETGSGKTFIAALLIKWVMAQPSQAGKKAVFLVPKVPLVDQQREFLAEQTPLSIRGYKGAMGVDVWDRVKWESEFAQSDCLVMTAQIFKDILVHGYWSLSKISLLVIDECHHAQKNHPYNMIMTDHYLPCQEKPKVFGMTASPIWNPKKPLVSIQTLQANLLSKVMAVREHTDLLEQHTSRPDEIILRFPSSSGLHYSTYYKPSLWERLNSVELLNTPGLNVRNLQTRYEATLNAVGPAGADRFLLSHASMVVHEKMRLKDALSQLDPKASRSKNAFIPYLKGKDSIFLNNLRNVTVLFEKRLLQDARALPSEWLSPKLQAMVAALVHHRSDTFQGIIFVDQRQIASVLSWILSRVAETKDWVRCGELTGHGDGAGDGDSIKGMGIKAQRDVVHSFKSGRLNLLVATSVAEEGLDFPACELVIRYDSIQHLVGYVQSRGRARQQKSTYIVMAEENDQVTIARYEGFRNAEPGLKTAYQNINAPGTSSNGIEIVGEPEDGEDDPVDLAERESYVIPSTGATLTYSSAVSFLNHLCSLIPRDAYTPPLLPKYIGDFQITLHLPRALPLSSDHLKFVGPPKQSKKEAKRAVAFMAVRTLHKLGVFDDHLSPVTSKKGENIEDADGRSIAKVSAVAPMMDVMVVSLWKAGPLWHLHIVVIEGRTCAGLLCRTPLPEVDLAVQGTRAQVRSHPSAVLFDLTLTQGDLVERFTKMGIWWCVTASPILSTPVCFIVPLTSTGAIDWVAMEKATTHEKGTYDWDGVDIEDEGKVMLMNSRKWGRPLLLKKIRLDLSLDSKPSTEETEEYDSYASYFENTNQLHFRKTEQAIEIQPPAGRIFEVSPIPRQPNSDYDFSVSTALSFVGLSRKTETAFLLPESYCRRALIDTDIIPAFQVLAPICQRLSDVYRARVARKALRYPKIPDDLLIEAFTLPGANAGFNNQRLETLGDSVLKLSVVVYIFNSFPNKHEGQLDALKTNSVCNRLLLARAKDVCLESFLIYERRRTRNWQFVLPSPKDSSSITVGSEDITLTRIQLPRRSLQDCMESSLGAAYLAGGINLALKAGAALRLCFGGSLPWPERYPASETVPFAALFHNLQDALQYRFNNGNLLVEAVKHPSFDSLEGGPCYQRLEFLGDAVIELVVTTYLYKKFPEATSGQLTWARARAICNATLAALAVKRLSLHKYILANSVKLSKAIGEEVATLGEASYEDVAINDWKYDPPKALADVFESVIGAVFVDSGFDFPRIVVIVEKVMEDVLKLLHPAIPRDPVTQLLEWIAKAGCNQAKFRRLSGDPATNRKDSVAVQVHDRIVAGPIKAANKPLAKGLVAEAAMRALRDESSELALTKICECMHGQVEEGEEMDMAPDLPVRDVREKDLNVETVEGFALAGRLRLEESMRGVLINDSQEEETDEELEMSEVEKLLDVMD